jgi:hypothetical protein
VGTFSRNGRAHSPKYATRGGQHAFDFLAEYTKPVLSHLEFRDDSGRPCVWKPYEGISLKPNVQFGRFSCIGVGRVG